MHVLSDPEKHPFKIEYSKISSFVHFFHDEKTEPKKSSQKQPSAGVFGRPTRLFEELNLEVFVQKIEMKFYSDISN